LKIILRQREEKQEEEEEEEKMRIRHTDWWQLEREKRYIILPMRGKKTAEIISDVK